MSELLPAALAVYALLVTLALLRLAGGRRRRRKPKGELGQGKTTNLVLLVLGSFLLAFIVAMTVIFCVKGAASTNANTNVAMMGETFKYVAPVAGALGVAPRTGSVD